ncbi:MAG: hypothetical protein GY795_11980 [Desulfobacterales bacterium]|nr:hypothetical protein [Desulfobacterales bacterium]
MKFWQIPRFSAKESANCFRAYMKDAKNWILNIEYWNLFVIWILDFGF